MSQFQESMRDALIFQDMSGMPEPFEGETLMKDGWKYADCNGKLSSTLFNALCSTFGMRGRDYRLLGGSRGADWARGQFLLSPSAYEAYMKTQTPGKGRKAK